MDETLLITHERGTLPETETRTGVPEIGQYGRTARRSQVRGDVPRCSAPDEIEVLSLETKGSPNLDVKVESVKEPKLKSESRPN